MKKVLFWDFHRTLAYSEHIWGDALFSAAKTVCPDIILEYDKMHLQLEHGFPWQSPYDDNTALVGENWWNHMNERFTEIYKMFGISHAEAEKASLLIRDMILDTSKYFLYDDTVSTLEKCLQKGYKNYIISNNYPELDIIMKSLDILKYFDEVIVSGIIGYDKPRTEIFEYAKTLAGSPEICYMTGDSELYDIIGGNKAGIKTIAVHNSRCRNATYNCKSLSEILNVIE